MDAPYKNLNFCLAVLMLRAANCSQETAASLLHTHKNKVSTVEHWFESLTPGQAAKFCDPHAMSKAFWLEIMTYYEDLKGVAGAAVMEPDTLLYHYDKLKSDKARPVFTPDRQQHYARLSDAAEKLRLNIKSIKSEKGVLVGDVTRGHIQLSKSETLPLGNVDHLDADNLLSHLKATMPDFDGIADWRDLNTNVKVVLQASDHVLKKLKEVSHGLALKGTCQICSSWG